MLETIPCLTSLLISDVGDHTMSHFSRYLRCWRPYHVSLLSLSQLLVTIPYPTSLVISAVGDHTIPQFSRYLRSICCVTPRGVQRDREAPIPCSCLPCHSRRYQTDTEKPPYLARVCHVIPRGIQRDREAPMRSSWLPCHVKRYPPTQRSSHALLVTFMSCEEALTETEKRSWP
ncbi:hypothetical protein RRG08_065267 [Elysia crispata]|uniref:Uncharacterized protein n=1 Tax=Elysia crispata TaxID=231223 RepID=A0AAE0YL61_9GAST|nr:hypothetical protein RRG08_065267 [Elysia crispata]